MFNTYINFNNKHNINFIYKSLKAISLENIGVKSKKITIKQEEITNNSSIIYSPKIGIKFSIYNTVVIKE